MSVHPYLFFTNTTREAMTRYHEILGGELNIMSAADMPPGEEPPPFEVSPDFVIHAALMFGDGDLIMASDDPTGDGTGVKGAALNISLADHDELRRIFAGLSEGGRVDMALAPSFWTPLFGSCVDRFGVSWMVNAVSESVEVGAA